MHEKNREKDLPDILSLLENGIEGALPEEAAVRISRANTVETFVTEGGTRKFWYDENGYLEKVTWNALDGTSSIETFGENDSTRTEYFDDGSIEGSSKNTFDKNGNMCLEIYYKPDGRLQSRGESEYDAQGNEIESIEYDSDGSVESTIEWEMVK